MPDQTSTRLNQEELDLERQLHEMLPARHGLDRDTLMFRAGERSGQRGTQQWRALSMVLAVMSGILAVAGFGRQFGDSKFEVAVAPKEHEPAMAASASEPRARVNQTLRPRGPWHVSEESEFLGLRERLMSQGLDALPTPMRAPPSTDVPNSLSDWLRQSRAGIGLNLSKSFNGGLTLGDPS